jgi:hypothetical protein
MLKRRKKKEKSKRETCVSVSSRFVQTVQTKENERKRGDGIPEKERKKSTSRRKGKGEEGRTDQSSAMKFK